MALLSLFLKKMRSFIKLYPDKVIIYLLVSFFHVFFISYSLLHKPVIKLKPTKKLSIKTYQLDEPAKNLATQYIKANSLTETPKKIIPAAKNKSQPLAKKNQKSAKKQSPSHSYPSKKPSQTQKLLQEMQESIAKIEANKDNRELAKQISIPKPIGELKSSHYFISSDDEKQKSFEYHEVLTKALKDKLSLPAYGKVKIRLTLEAGGDVIRLETIYSDSEINRLYLEKNLPKIAFPKFSGDLSAASQYCFSLIFCSDDF